MQSYIVTVTAKLFSVNRLVVAASKAAAAAQVSQEGARTVWVSEPFVDNGGDEA